METGGDADLQEQAHLPQSQAPVENVELGANAGRQGESDGNERLDADTDVLCPRRAGDAHRFRAEPAEDQRVGGEDVGRDADHRGDHHRAGAVDRQQELLERRPDKLQRRQGDDDLEVDRLEARQLRLVSERCERARRQRQDGQRKKAEDQREPDPLPQVLSAGGVILPPERLTDEGVHYPQHAHAQGDDREGEDAAVGGGGGRRDPVADAAEHPRVEELHHRVRRHLRHGRQGQAQQFGQRSLFGLGCQIVHRLNHQTKNPKAVASGLVCRQIPCRGLRFVVRLDNSDDRDQVHGANGIGHNGQVNQRKKGGRSNRSPLKGTGLANAKKFYRSTVAPLQRFTMRVE